MQPGQAGRGDRKYKECETNAHKNIRLIDFKTPIGRSQRSHAGHAENTDLARRTQRSQRKDGADHPPSTLDPCEKEGDRRHFVLRGLCALSAKSVFSAATARDPQVASACATL